MAGAVGVFERVLLAGMAASNREALASRARAGVVLGQMHLDY